MPYSLCLYLEAATVTRRVLRPQLNAACDSQRTQTSSLLLEPEAATVTSTCVLPALLRNTIMSLKCCTICARESSTLTVIKLHRQRCPKYHENHVSFQALKKRASDASQISKEGTKVASSHQRGEPQTTQMRDNVRVVMFSNPTEH